MTPLICLVSLCLAASPEVVPGETLEVRLVQVELWASDGDGRPVTDLSPDEVELRLDGRPWPLAHFEAPKVEKEHDERVPQLRLALVIDSRFLEPGDLHDVLGELPDFLRAALGPEDGVLLVLAGRRFEIRGPFRHGVGAVIAELEDWSRSPPAPSRSAGEARQILAELERARAFDDVGSLGTANQSVVAEALRSRIEAFSAEVQGEVGRSAEQLERVVVLMAGWSGRRAVLYLGGRLPTRTPLALFEAWDRAFGSLSDVANPNQPAGPGGQDDESAMFFATSAAASAPPDPGRPLRVVAARAAQRGVTVHSFDLGALRSSGTFLAAGSDPRLGSRGFGQAGSAELDPDRSLTGTVALQALAELTGGRHLVANRDFGRTLAGVKSDLEGAYTVAFLPPLEESGSEHEIELRLISDRPGVRLRYRRSYLLREREAEMAERTLAALTLGSGANPLAAEIEVLAGGELTVSVPLERLALVAARREHLAQLSVWIAIEGQGEPELRRATLPLRLGNEQLLTSLGRRAEYRTELPGHPTPEAVAVTIRDDFRSLASTLFLPVGAQRP